MYYGRHIPKRKDAIRSSCLYLHQNRKEDRVLPEKSPAQFEPEALVECGDNEALLGSSVTSDTRSRWHFISLPISLIFHISLVVLYTITFLLVLNSQTNGPRNLSEAITNLHMEFKPLLSITAGASPYAGAPSKEIDEAWHELLGNTSIRVSQEELMRNGNHKESVALDGSGGYMVWLGVFHQLYCIKMLRQLNYRKTYHPNMTKDEERDMEVHINHCVELLRQAVMCKPDTTLTTFTWTHSQKKPVLDVRRFERQCVDWEAFMSSEQEMKSN